MTNPTEKNECGAKGKLDNRSFNHRRRRHLRLTAHDVSPSAAGSWPEIPVQNYAQ